MDDSELTIKIAVRSTSCDYDSLSCGGHPAHRLRDMHFFGPLAAFREPGSGNETSVHSTFFGL